MDKRKRQLSEFRELFKALFKIPDRGIQDRVLAAINGVIKDTECNCYKKEVSEVGTQTDLMSPMSISSISSISSTIIKSQKGYLSQSGVASMNGPKRRKRTRIVPRVEKSKNERTPFLKHPTMNGPHVDTGLSVIPEKWLDSIDFDKLSEPHDPEPIKTTAELIKIMKIEYVTSKTYVNGLLPIHKAICEKNIKLFKRQLYVLKERKVNVNDLFTENHESPLQLAIKSDSSTAIVKDLLNQNAQINELDENGNTILHLALANIENITILRMLLEKIDIDLILEKNYDGLTCLHVGVRKENFLLCKCLLEYIDEKLGIISIGKDIFNENELKEEYIKELKNFADKKPMQLNSKKLEILNSTDIKNKWTPLYYAVTLDLKLMIFMLLCHLGDPRVTDHSGSNCITYADNMENFSSQIKYALYNTATYLERCENC